MSEPGFTGKFQQPAEAFSVQHFEFVDLNRLPPEVLLWTVALAVIGLGVHFLLQTLPEIRRRRERK